MLLISFIILTGAAITAISLATELVNQPIPLMSRIKRTILKMNTKKTIILFWNQESVFEIQYATTMRTIPKMSGLTNQRRFASMSADDGSKRSRESAARSVEIPSEPKRIAMTPLRNVSIQMIREKTNPIRHHIVFLIVGKVQVNTFCIHQSAGLGIPG
jgi:hypothetical protein